MKQIHLILLALCIFLCTDATANPLYIYSSSRGVIALNTNEIDSINYIPATEESPALQEFFTADKSYSIPVEEIDSVGFRTPANEMVPDVDRTSDLSDYVVSTDMLTLYLDRKTPVDVLPGIGQTIFVAADSVKMTLPFAGRVNSVNNVENAIAVECDPVELTEIFKTYYGVSGDENTPDFGPDRERRSSDHRGSGVFTPSPISLNWLNQGLTYEFNEDSPFSLGGYAGWTTTISPKFRYSGYTIITPDHGVNVGVTVISDVDFEDVIKFNGSIQFGNDLKLFGAKVIIPEALIDLYFEIGITGSVSASVAMDHTFVNNYRHVFHFDWSSKDKGSTLTPVCSLMKTGESHKGRWAIEGSISGGVYVELGVAFICTSSLDICKADVRFEKGLQAQGDWVPSIRESKDAMNSSDYYHRVENCKVQKGIYTSGAAELHLFKWSKKYDKLFFEQANTFEPFEETAFVPKFSNVKAEKSGSMANATATVSGSTYPCGIGMAITNNNDKSVKTDYNFQDYVGPSSTLSANFTGLPEWGNFKVRPVVNSMGVEMVADPVFDIVEIPIFGSYTCIWNTTPPNAKLLSMVLYENYMLSQTYYYANRGETVTYHSYFAWEDDYLIIYKDNGDTQIWHIDELTEQSLVISQSDGFTYNLRRQ